MTLPPRLRDYYDKVVTPASGGNTVIRIEIFILFKSFYCIKFENTVWFFKSFDLSSGTSGGGVGLGTGQLLAGQLGTATGSSRTHSRLTGGAIQHMVQAYSTMNRFLARFLEHVIKLWFNHSMIYLHNSYKILLHISLWLYNNDLISFRHFET